MRHVVSSCSTFLPSTIKIFQFQRVFATERTRNLFQTKGNNSKSKKAGVVILVPDMSVCLVPHFYHISSNYSKGYSSYRADKKFYAVANWIHPKNNMSPYPLVKGDITDRFFGKTCYSVCKYQGSIRCCEKKTGKSQLTRKCTPVTH